MSETLEQLRRDLEEAEAKRARAGNRSKGAQRLLDDRIARLRRKVARAGRRSA